jgi:DNA-binding PadR family transcriptional regulator
MAYYIAPMDKSSDLEGTPLTPLSLHLLLALAERDEHGYGLMKRVREASGGRLKPATGTVYLALQRLEEDGLIVEAPAAKSPPDERQRRIYRLTPLGRKTVRREAERLAGIVARAAELKLLSRKAVAALAGGESDG